MLIIPTVLLVTVIVFLGMRMIPGDLVDYLATQVRIFGGRAEVVDMIRRNLGLDLPLHVQYGKWLSGLVQGDLGRSFYSGRPVLDTILGRLPISFEVGFLAILSAMIIGVPVGIYSGIRPESALDHVLRSVSIVMISVPAFWIGAMITIYPAIWWRWAPPRRYVPFFGDPVANLALFIIPAVVLGLALSGVLMRLTRTMMLEVLRQDFVRTAWAKGLRERVVVIRHVLRNSLIPIVTMLGLQLPILLGGAVVVEFIFGLPGLGSLVLASLESRDYPVVSGINLVVAGFVLVGNLLVDVSYAWLDPRTRYR